MNMPKFSTFCRFLLGAVFLIGGLLKAIDANYFYQLVLDDYVSNEIGAKIIAISIPPVEFCIGFLILINRTHKRLYQFVTILLLVFTLFIIKNYLNDLNADCGCFGSFIVISPLWSILKNVFLIIISIYLTKKTIINNFHFAQQSIVFLCSVLILLNVFNLNLKPISAPIKEPTPAESYIGKHIDSTLISKFISFPKDKRRVGLFFYSPMCTHCWNVSFNVIDIKNQGIIDTLLGISFQYWAKDSTSYKNYFKPNFVTTYLPDDQFKQIILNTPLFLIVENNIIQKSYILDIPCGRILANEYKMNKKN